MAFPPTLPTLPMYVAVLSFLLVGVGCAEANQAAPAIESRARAAMQLATRSVALDELVLDADFVFQGDVTSIRHRLSEGIHIPHTFVSYRIKRMLKGRTEANFITLRFLGGPTGKPGQYMLAEGTPLFDVGDTVILFVTNNTNVSCPLVGCSAGIFRIGDQTKIYSDEGQALLLAKDGFLAFGDYAPSEDLVTHRLPQSAPGHSRGELQTAPTGPTLRLESEDAVQQDDATLSEQPDSSEPVTADVFAALIVSIAVQQGAGETEPDTPVVSADPRESFYVRVPQATAPPADPAPDLQPSDKELEELELYHRNHRNPVIKRSDVR